MKIYYLVAVWKQGDALRITKMCEGSASQLRVDVDLLPQNTIRVGVIEKKEFDSLASAQAEETKKRIEKIVSEAKSDLDS